MSTKMYDVVVAGGGPSGIAAAVGSARAGASTLLVEKGPFLGGCLAMQLPILVFHNQRGQRILGGVAHELVMKVVEAGGSMGHLPNSLYSSMRTFTYMDIETMKYCADQLVTEAGVDVLLHAYAGDVVMDGDRVTGVVVHGKGGQEVIQAGRVVDCSADADLAYAAGVPIVKGDDQGNLMVTTMSMRLVNVDHSVLAETFDDWLTIGPRPGSPEDVFLHGKTSFVKWKDQVIAERLFEDMDAENHSIFVVSMWDGEMTMNVSRIMGVDASDKWSVTQGEIKGRAQVRQIHQFLKKHVPGFEKSVLISTGPVLGTRESRRIVGEYTMQVEDILEARNPVDQIGRGAFPIDIHHHDGSGIKQTFVKDGRSYGIPYRILVPKERENLLVAGRCVSVARAAHGAIRQMGCCMATGHAAGVAAALSVQAQTTPREIEVESLQDTLFEQGAVISEDHAPETIPTPEGYEGPVGVLDI